MPTLDLAKPSAVDAVVAADLCLAGEPAAVFELSRQKCREVW
jgi:hypothetical protein